MLRSQPILRRLEELVRLRNSISMLSRYAYFILFHVLIHCDVFLNRLSECFLGVLLTDGELFQLQGQVTTNYAASVLRALGRHNSVPRLIRKLILIYRKLHEIGVRYCKIIIDYIRINIYTPLNMIEYVFA